MKPPSRVDWYKKTKYLGPWITVTQLSTAFKTCMIRSVGVGLCASLAQMILALHYYPTLTLEQPPTDRCSLLTLHKLVVADISFSATTSHYVFDKGRHPTKMIVDRFEPKQRYTYAISDQSEEEVVFVRLPIADPIHAWI